MESYNSQNTNIFIQNPLNVLPPQSSSYIILRSETLQRGLIKKEDFNIPSSQFNEKYVSQYNQTLIEDIKENEITDIKFKENFQNEDYDAYIMRDFFDQICDSGKLINFHPNSKKDKKRLIEALQEQVSQENEAFIFYYIGRISSQYEFTIRNKANVEKITINEIIETISRYKHPKLKQVIIIVEASKSGAIVKLCNKFEVDFELNVQSCCQENEQSHFIEGKGSIFTHNLMKILRFERNLEFIIREDQTPQFYSNVQTKNFLYLGFNSWDEMKEYDIPVERQDQDGIYYYYGQIKNGLRHGLGTQYCLTNNLKGNWFLNQNKKFLDKKLISKKLQKINYKQPSEQYGLLYQGQFFQDQKNGFGTQKYLDGSVYQGFWKQNKRNGRGMLLFSNFYKIEGQWYQDQINYQTNEGISSNK